MNQIIKPTTINFSEILKNSTTTLQLSETTQSKLIDILNEEFTEAQQHLYVANLWMYMNYHPTNDFPINLEDVFKEIGFANKGNAKKTLESNFTINEDYKVLLFPTEKRKKPASAYAEAGLSIMKIGDKNKITNHTNKIREEVKAAPEIAGNPLVHTNLGGAGLNKEKIMLNTDTFKSLCMIAKTPQGKEMRKYYVKLENINHRLISEELKEQKLLLIEQATKYTKEKEQIWKNSFRNKYVVYLIIISEDLIKFGFTKDFDERLSAHKTDYGKKIQIAFIIESKNNEMLETLFKNHQQIKPNRISQVFKGENKTELIKLDKDLSLKNIISILTETNKFIDTVIETQVFKKYNIDINYTKEEEENIPVKKEKKIKVKSKAELAKIENDIKIITEYLEAKTIKSKLCSDAISMNNLYYKFCEWIKVIYPNEDIIKQRVFTTRMKSTEIVNYSDKISNLKYTSGITNIKFK